uniref:Ig-like domain-containing protein n=1 Tax=Fundulus heteroclitus TaxID=8078 RepID=A0A3Q2QKA7_FUNHE
MRWLQVLVLLIHYLLYCRSSLSDQVHQTPFYIQANPGETVEISCSHSIQNYDRILWYRRSQDTQLHFLGYMLQSLGNPEPAANVTMKGSANKDKTCTLIIKELRVNSSAVYFCAASYHSAAYHCCSVQKPPCMLPMHLYDLL